MQPTNDDVTLGEVGRKVDDLARNVESLAANMAERPSWPDVRRIERGWEDRLTAAGKQNEIVARTHERQINTLVAWQTWAGRLVMGGVASAVIGAVFVFRP